MRKLETNTNDTFRVKAYAGTNGVLLAFDVDESKKAGLLGFAIEQKEENKDWQWLLNSKTFPDRPHTISKWNATPTNLAPIQKFRWADYVIEPGTSCRYRVHLVYGSAVTPELRESLEISVKTDDGKPADHGVIFNRAVAASQAFGRKFPDLDKHLRINKGLPIEKWPDEPRDWLQNGLLNRILQFIARAENDKWTLDVAIYEYELAAIVQAVHSAHRRGVEIRILYHAKQGDHQTVQNEASLKKIPKANKRARVTNAIFHDKFIVLSKRNAQGERVPKAVLCGSTNFTENGVYRQANVVHVVAENKISQVYLRLFEAIWAAPADVPATKKWINQNNPLDPTNRLFAGFSPRTGKADLTEFIDIVNSADRDLLFATAFKLPEDVLDALLGRANDTVLRYGIQNTKSRITGFHADRTAEFTVPALLTSGLEGWVKEGLRGQRGNLLIHTKAIIANFSSDNPVIISGSHNLSAAASSNNDENYLIIRGDTDLADRYGLEVLRFYDHYRFRFHVRELKLKKVGPLAMDDSWTNDYYMPGNLKELSRVRFSGR